MAYFHGRPAHSKNLLYIRGRLAHFQLQTRIESLRIFQKSKQNTLSG